MQEMKTFCVWLLSEVANFLMTEPIIYFVGIAFALLVVGILKSIININH